MTIVKKSNDISSRGRTHRGPRGALATGLVSAGAAIVYSLLFSTHLTEDSLWYARDILTPGRLYLHPHHLLYNPMMRALLSPVASLIREPEARLTYLQAWNVVFGAAAIVTSRSREHSIGSAC